MNLKKEGSGLLADHFLDLVSSSISTECAPKFLVQLSICAKYQLKMLVQRQICAKHVDESMYFSSWALTSDQEIPGNWHDLVSNI